MSAQLLTDSASVAGDSISRGFDADTGSCNYGDNVSRNWATGDDHGASYCSPGSNGTYSLSERLECAKGGTISNFNSAESGATMVGDFYNQATAIRSNLSSAPAPRLVNVLLGHNDACTSETTRSGNSCGGDRDPQNYCRTTNAAFEREFRRGMDELIQIPNARIAVLAVIRVSQLCNFENKNGCGLSFGLNCDFIWTVGDIVGDLFGGGICASLTTDCSNQRRIDMYNTVVGYNEVLERVTNEYVAISTGGSSATGALKAADVGIRYGDGSFYYKFASDEVSCCDCFHPSDAGQLRLADFAWDGLDCGVTVQCCGVTSDTLAAATCSFTDTWSSYEGGFWQDGLICGNGVVDPGEQCDDGNTVSGDCCSVSCESVAAGMACPDDGDQCTAGSCDGFGGCVHEPLDGTACDDGVFCNGTELCGLGVCGQSSGDPCEEGGVCNDACDESADHCFVPAGTACPDDGNICTTDVCDGVGVCGLTNQLPCDDGSFCNGADFCGAGACSVHLGDPCAAGGDCADTCNEADDNCFDPAGAGCISDGNSCTDDLCNGLGECLHAYNTLPCDDANACTGDDSCSAGSCLGTAVVCENCQACDPFSGCGGPMCTATATVTKTPTATFTATPSPTPPHTRTATPAATATPLPTLTATSTPLPIGCSPTPVVGCRSADKSLVLLRSTANPDRKRVLWKFLRGASTDQLEFGLPLATTEYALCVYDGAGQVLTIRVDPDDIRWNLISGRGFSYRDSAGAQDGVQKLLLKGSDRDRTKLMLKAKGAGIPAMSLASTSVPLTVQLLNSDTTVCWESVFDSDDIKRNEVDYLKAVSR